MPDLFDYGPCEARREAFEGVAPKMSRLRREALQALDRLGGQATSIEAVEASGLDRWSVGPRFSELRKMGLVEPTGERRLTPSGRGAAVLRLTPLGLAALRERVDP